MTCDGCLETIAAPRTIRGIGKGVECASCPFCGTVYVRESASDPWRMAKFGDFNPGDLEKGQIKPPPQKRAHPTQKDSP